MPLILCQRKTLTYNISAIWRKDVIKKKTLSYRVLSVRTKNKSKLSVLTDKKQWHCYDLLPTCSEHFECIRLSIKPMHPVDCSLYICHSKENKLQVHPSISQCIKNGNLDILLEKRLRQLFKISSTTLLHIKT